MIAGLVLAACADAPDADETGFDENQAQSAGPSNEKFVAPVGIPREDTVAEHVDVAIDKTPGSESRTGTGPTIYSKNVVYTLTLPFTAPHAGPITGINYNWNLS